jgi:flagellar motor switch protein FliG
MFLAFTGLCVLYAGSAYTASNETSEEYSFKMSVERHLESKLNSVLRDVTGINQLIAIVKVEVKKQKKKRKPTLPGIPTIKGPDYFGENQAKSNVIVQKLNVKILIDRNVSKELSDIIHNVAISLIGYNPDRGDTLVVENFEFMKGNSGVASILTPPHIYYVLMAIPVVVFLVAASMFFFNPYRHLKFSLQEIGVVSKSGSSEEKEMAAPTPVLQTIKGSGLKANSPEGDIASAADNRLFGFLGAYKLTDIMFALRNMEPEEIAIALNYMDSALAAEVIGRLDEEVRKTAVEKLIATKQLDEETVKALEEKLKLRLTFRSGGDDKLASILENTDENLRDSLMDSIEQQDSGVASRLGHRIRTFESVLRMAKPASIDTLVRHISPPAFARILASAPGDVQGKVLDSLGTGVAELLREELKYAKPLAGTRLRNEKRNVIQEFLSMAEAGIIEESIEEEV